MSYWEHAPLFLLLLCLWYVFGGGLVGETILCLKVHQQIKVKDSRPNAAIFRGICFQAGPWLVPGNFGFTAFPPLFCLPGTMNPDITWLPRWSVQIMWFPGEHLLSFWGLEVRWFWFDAGCLYDLPPIKWWILSLKQASLGRNTTLVSNAFAGRSTLYGPSWVGEHWKLVPGYF